jgi:parallel beta-helix repeat protein
MRSRTLRGALTLAILVALAFAIDPPGAPAADAAVIRVPQDAATLQQAIERANPGDLILLDRGTYPGGIVVPEDRPGITIRGIDRNAVVLDGRNVLGNAIEIEADHVTVENLSAHDFTNNAFYWDGVDGFAGRYLTVWNVNLYGIYAIQSRDGLFEDSYVSGAADAAFYIGECNPCDSILRRLTARYSAVGYSGTNAGGNLEVRDSLWEFNGSGIMPNSYDGQAAPAPQTDTLFTGNTIRGSGTVPVPANSPLAGYVGIGIAINGGADNRIEGNTIADSDRYGIALFPSLQQDGSRWLANGNRVTGNTISGSGTADLAMAGGMETPSCFEGNTFGSSLPPDIETVMPCDGNATADTDRQAEADLAIPIPEALERLGERPAYSEMPVPDAQPTMPGDPARPGIVTVEAPLFAAPPGVPLLLAAVAAIFVVVGLFLVWRVRR